MTEIDHLAGWLGILREAQAQKAKAEEAIAVARQHIEDALGDDEVGTIAGAPVVRWTHVVSRRFDTGKAKALLAPEQVDACTVESTTRRFVVVEAAQ